MFKVGAKNYFVKNLCISLANKKMTKFLTNKDLSGIFSVYSYPLVLFDIVGWNQSSQRQISLNCGKRVLQLAVWEMYRLHIYLWPRHRIYKVYIYNWKDVSEDEHYQADCNYLLHDDEWAWGTLLCRQG